MIAKIAVVKRAKPVKTRPVRPNLGIEAAYTRQMRQLLREMHDSVFYWVGLRYRQNAPLIAQDDAPRRDRSKPSKADFGPPKQSGPDAKFAGGNAGKWIAYVDGEMLRRVDGAGKSYSSRESALAAATKAFGGNKRGLPANELEEAIAKLSKRWLKQFDEAAPKLADYFATEVSERTDASLAKILRDGGFTVKFKMTRGMRDIVNATTTANVSLIKSIPRKYLADVEGAVMRSIQTGRDLGTLTKELQQAYGVSHRRAALISRDQNNKATAAMTRGRQSEVGITTATWLHSGGGKHPRPAHVAMSGKTYDVAKGMYDPVEKKFIFPGELVNCRCVSISNVPGFD